jgi:hypothetical protein
VLWFNTWSLVILNVFLRSDKLPLLNLVHMWCCWQGACIHTICGHGRILSLLRWHFPIDTGHIIVEIKILSTLKAVLRFLTRLYTTSNVYNLGLVKVLNFHSTWELVLLLWCRRQPNLRLFGDVTQLVGIQSIIHEVIDEPIHFLGVFFPITIVVVIHVALLNIVESLVHPLLVLVVLPLLIVRRRI